MPVYDYKCNDCGCIYDIYHKSKEITEDVICPKCESRNHKKLMSIPMVSIGTNNSISNSDYKAPSCEPGGCCGGSCGLN
jgi:putative FmdB family regulatory protein